MPPRSATTRGGTSASWSIGWLATGAVRTRASGRCVAGGGTSSTRSSCAGWRWTAGRGWRTSAPSGRTEPPRLAEARLLFEQMLGYGNRLGLYAEQTGPSGEALGNFPQAFTHLALISAAFNLDRALAGRAD